MARFPISSLHDGMNLLDADAAIPAGMTKESLGCDFSVPGQITPMRQGLLTWTLSASILDAHIVYIQGIKYLFTTHADGLRVTYGGHETLIDSSFTGTFKILPINDEYVVMSSSVLCRKWKPGWATTYQWGLNTPPIPTLAVGSLDSKVIDACDSLTDWVIDGGGAGGALALDTTNFLEGTASLQLTCDANQTATITKAFALDLSMYLAEGDTGGNNFIKFAFYTATLKNISSFKVKFSCAANGLFDKDFYSITVDLSGEVDQASLSYGSAGYSPINEPISGDYSQAVEDGVIATEPYQPKDEVLTVWKAIKDGGVGKPDIVVDYTVKTKPRRTEVTSVSWSTIKMAKSEFVRTGGAVGRDWATITAIQIELTAAKTQAIVSFDDWKMQGKDLWGYYFVAVAYENELGNYGPYSDFAGPVYLEGDDLTISGLTVDADPQTTKRRLAILGGFISEPMVYWLEDNTSTSLNYNEPDSSLSTKETMFNNHPPSPFRDMVEVAGRIFMVGMSSHKNWLAYSEPLFFEGFPYKNYRIVAEGEDLYQVAVVGQTIVTRGMGREWVMQLSGDNPSFWQGPFKGVAQGGVSSRLLLETDGGHVYMSENGFYHSPSDVYYLPKINPTIASPANAFGAMKSKRAFVAFTDTGGTARMMHIDYRLGKPVAHYIENLAPTTIFSDDTLDKTYYALDTGIYEFDAHDDPLSCTLHIPGQFCGSSRVKDFSELVYELEDGPLVSSFKVDRRPVVGTCILATATQEADPVSLPFLQGKQIELILSSEQRFGLSPTDFILYLPIEIEAVPI